MENQLQALQAEALQEMQQAQTVAALNELKVKYLGKKGSLTAVLRGMGALSPEERPRIGALVNEVRAKLEELLEERAGALKAAELQERLEKETIDITLGGRTSFTG